MNANDFKLILELENSNDISANIKDKIFLLLKIVNHTLYTHLINKLKNIINDDFHTVTKIDLRIVDSSTLKGGLSENITPKIHKKWKESVKQNLIIINKDDNNKLFKFNTMLSEKDTIPLFKSGTFTSVYIIKKYNSDNRDTVDKNYILRCYEINKPIHILDDQKIIDEYINFYQYLIKIYYYGHIFLDENKWEYIITDKYYRAYEDKELLKNKEKFKYLKNIVILLDELYKKNLYINDLKITNIGWKNKYDLIPIMIDYDEFTLLNINKCINDRSTYLPPYDLFCVPNNFNKFSIGGLANIMENLAIKYTPIKKTESTLNRGKEIDTNDLIKSLNILKKDYYEKDFKYIPYEDTLDYSEILAVLNYLEANKYVIN
jgi:hypothetical protein